MKFRKIFFLWLALIISVTTLTRGAQAQAAAQGDRLYQQMSQDEQRAFVAEQARRIAREMSGTEYEFTPDFEANVQRLVEKYARRIGSNAGAALWKGDARFVFARGQEFAPTLISAFKARNVSPLIGLYLPLIESEYVNLPAPNSVGAIGMFQFLPKTGERYGLSAQDLLDVEKSADAAARYIADGLKQFKDDPMKEALAILAYNRGEQKTSSALRLVIDEQNRRCSICALTAASQRLDETFQRENVHYVPSFFAAAIIGENPRAFGLQQQPLSSYETKR
jgi:membrane-bound lytic murein transglycosylase D